MTKKEEEFFAEYRKEWDQMENIGEVISFLLSFGIIFVIAFWVIPTDLTTAIGGLLALAKGAVAVPMALFFWRKLAFRLHEYYRFSKAGQRRLAKLHHFVDTADGGGS